MNALPCGVETLASTVSRGSGACPAFCCSTCCRVTSAMPCSNARRAISAPLPRGALTFTNRMEISSLRERWVQRPCRRRLEPGARAGPPLVAQRGDEGRVGLHPGGRSELGQRIGLEDVEPHRSQPAIDAADAEPRALGLGFGERNRV